MWNPCVDIISTCTYVFHTCLCWPWLSFNNNDALCSPSFGNNLLLQITHGSFHINLGIFSSCPWGFEERKHIHKATDFLYPAHVLYIANHIPIPAHSAFRYFPSSRHHVVSDQVRVKAGEMWILILASCTQIGGRMNVGSAPSRYAIHLLRESRSDSVNALSLIIFLRNRNTNFSTEFIIFLSFASLLPRLPRSLFGERA